MFSSFREDDVHEDAVVLRPPEQPEARRAGGPAADRAALAAKEANSPRTLATLGVPSLLKRVRVKMSTESLLLLLLLLLSLFVASNATQRNATQVVVV